MWRSRGRARASGKLFENRNSFPKFLDLVLCIPAFLAEPDYCLSNVCHQIPPRVTFVGHCITKSQVLSEFITAKVGLPGASMPADDETTMMNSRIQKAAHTASSQWWEKSRRPEQEESANRQAIDRRQRGDYKLEAWQL